MEHVMTPPEERVSGILAETPDPPPAVLAFRIETLKNRPDFLRAAQARRQGTAGFLLQARARGDDLPLVRVGFTASKKIGNAVARNRAKRRLREVARAVLPRLARPGWDYVLVARPGVTTTRPYALLLSDLAAALRSLHP
jgi:ribonuclease P protein component